MPWKAQEVDGKKVIVADTDGKPIWEDDSGTTMSIDWSRASNTIKNLMSESKQKRESNDQLTSKITELTTEIDTLKKDKNKDKNKDTNTQALESQFNTKLDEIKNTFESQLKQKEQELSNLLIGNKFATSQFIKEKTILPSDLAQLKFGNNFKVENGQVIPIGQDGQRVMSVKNIGETASFDEALEMQVDKYQYKDQVLKGSQHSGGDGNPSVKPIKNMFISDLKTAKDKLEFINKHGKEEFTNLVQKGKRPSK